MNDQKTASPKIIALEKMAMDMMSLAGGGHAVRDVYNYLVRCHNHFGDDTDAEHALNDLIRAAKIAIQEYKKNLDELGL